MGIIVSTFPGIGKTYFSNLYGDKIKIADFSSYNDFETLSERIIGVVDNNDVVFVGHDNSFRNALDERNLDYDIFYPSKDRRKEFLENMVRKRALRNDIMMLDREFDKIVDRIDAIESDNCYKHKMEELGHFIGNDAAIMQYINNVEQNSKKNEQKPSEGVEESPRGEENNETDEA
jgi:hypothetical protein